MSWRDHFPSYPQDAMPAIPKDWLDVSWRNDLCPRFAIPALSVCVWVDWPNPKDRECGNKRFVVHVCDPETLEVPEEGECLFETDDFLRLLGWLVALEVTLGVHKHS